MGGAISRPSASKKWIFFVGFQDCVTTIVSPDRGCGTSITSDFPAAKCVGVLSPAALSVVSAETSAAVSAARSGARFPSAAMVSADIIGAATYHIRCKGTIRDHKIASVLAGLDLARSGSNLALLYA